MDIRRILVVDDESIIVTFLRSLLAAEKSNYAIRTAMTGDEAIAQAIEWSPHLIILDLNIPGKDGFEVCKTIRNNIKCRQTIVVGMTGQADQDRLDRIREAGAAECFVKPFTLSDFVAKVRKYADKGLEMEAMLVDTK